MKTRDGGRAARATGESGEPLVDLSEVTEIELLILRRMREFTIGDHRSVFHGTGFDFVGLRDWEPGDRVSAIDWPQSTLTNFTPFIVREFEQPSTAPVVAVADRSLSTRCAVDGTPIGAGVARAIATIGMSAVFFQDLFGLVTFDEGFSEVGAVPPRIGKSQVIHCLEAYQRGTGLQDVKRSDSVSRTIAGLLRKTSLIPVVSDFLFDQAGDVLRELSLLNSTHDVFIVIVDAGFAFELPDVSAGWIDVFDVESGRPAVVSRGALAALPARVRTWQDEVERQARDLDLDVLRLERDPGASAVALAEFVAERRLRKK